VILWGLFCTFRGGRDYKFNRDQRDNCAASRSHYHPRVPWVAGGRVVGRGGQVGGPRLGNWRTRRNLFRRWAACSKRSGRSGRTS